MDRVYVFIDDERDIPPARDEYDLPNDCAKPDDCQEALLFRSYEDFFLWVASGIFSGQELVLALDHDMGTVTSRQGGLYIPGALRMDGLQAVLKMRELKEDKQLPPIIRARVHSWNISRSLSMVEALFDMNINAYHCPFSG